MIKNFSVLMSVYARENAEFLAQSIESMMVQTHPTDNFVLVCDGPLTDALDTVVEQYESAYPDFFVIVRCEYNKGLAAALNAGLPFCTNEYVARMDSDDIAKPERIALQLADMARTGADVAGSAVEEFINTPGDEGILRKTPENNADIRHFARRRNPFNHSTVVFRKSAVLAAGGYMESPYCEDYHLWVRMLQNGCTGYNNPQVLQYMRIGGGMYKRRGGVSYFKAMVRFALFMNKIGFTTYGDLLVRLAGQAVTSLMPGAIQKLVYKRVLRNRLPKSAWRSE